MYWWLKICLGIYLLIVVSTMLFIRNMLQKINKRKLIVKEIKEEEKAFVRDDYNEWNLYEIYIVGGVLLVPRLLMFLVMTFLHYCVVKVVVSVESTQPYSILGSKVIKWSGQLFLRMVLVSCGFYYIPHYYRNIQSYYPDYQPESV